MNLSGSFFFNRINRVCPKFLLDLLGFTENSLVIKVSMATQIFLMLSRSTCISQDGRIFLAKVKRQKKKAEKNEKENQTKHTHTHTRAHTHTLNYE